MSGLTARPVGDGDGHDGLLDDMASVLRADMIAALPGLHPWHEVVDALLPVVTAWAEQRARQRAAEELRAAADDWDLRGLALTAAELRVRADAQAADDRTGQR